MGKTTEGQDFQKRPFAAFLAPAKMCFQMSFCFKVPASVIWCSCSSSLHPFLQFMDCLLLTLSSRATNPKESRQRLEDIGMRSTLSPYVGHCWRTVLCMYLGPASVSSPTATRTPTFQPVVSSGER